MDPLAMRYKRQSKPNLDHQLIEALAKSWNLSVPWFLCASYLYYYLDESVISDQTFDWMCEEMLERWKTIEHPHKVFITKPMLKTGSGHSINFRKIPTIIKGAADQMLMDYKKHS